MWICQKINLIRVVSISLVIIILFLTFPSVGMISLADHKAELPEKHLTIFLVPGLSFEELEWITENSNRQTWDTGSIAAVNLRPEGQYSYLNNTLSLVSGKRAIGIKGWNAFESGEKWDGVIPVENLFLRWHGDYPTSSLIHPQYHDLLNKNRESSFQATVGWLGDSLESHRIGATVIGHSDTDVEKIRYASLFVMNSKGEAEGKLTYPIVDNPLYPGGIKTDVDKVVDYIKVQEQGNNQSFSVVEWGDLHRLFVEKNKMTPAQHEIMYQQLLTDLDEALDKILRNSNGEVWLLSPAVNEGAYQDKNQLGPLWIWNEDRDMMNDIYSGTTRRAGLVSNTDIAPTIATRLNIDYPKDLVLGQPMEFIGNDREKFTSFLTRVQEINKVYANRGAVLSSYISGLVAMLVIVSCVIWFLNQKAKWKRFAKTLLLSGVFSPFWFLVTGPLVLPLTSFQYVMMIGAVSVLSALFLGSVTKEPFSIACAIFFTALILDVVFLNSYYTLRSFLSYDPVIGARYYGIGNEFAGIFLVSGLLLVTPLVRRGWNFSIVVIIMTLILVLGTSSFGANAGASLATGAVLLFIVDQQYFSKKTVGARAIYLLGFFIGVFAVLYLVQLAQPASHITAGFDRLFSGDWQTTLQTIRRKLEMNWKIFKVSYWTQLFITSYFFIGLIIWRRRKEHLLKHQEFLINCCIVASLGLLLLNDSGIVAAATSMFITLCVCYGWSLNKQV